MNKRLAYLALVLSGICWGMGFPLGKLALREMPAAHMVLLRFGVAAIAAAPFAFASKDARDLFRSPWVLGAGLLYGLAFLVQFEGLSHVSVTLAALMVGAMPALIAVCAYVMGDKVSRTSWIGVAAATAGAALIAGKPGTAGSPLGVALSMGSLLIFLAWLVVLKRAPQVKSVIAMPAVTVVVAAAVILPVAVGLHGAPKLELLPVTWLAVAGQGVLSTLVATAAWQYGASRISSASAGVFINIEPLFGACIGVLAFHDHLTAALAAGGALIVAGSLTVVRGEKATPPHEGAPPTPA
jgi:drug/metabolite transporter (DMT)-like permease